MKKIISLVLTLFAVLGAFAQGSFNLNNYTAGNVLRLFGERAGTGYTVQAFWGPLGTLEENLSPLTAVVPLLDSSAGWFDFGTIDTQPGNPGPTPTQVLVQMRGTGPLGTTGRSPVILQNIVYTPNTPGDLGFTGDWYIIPEPSTLSLAGLGAVALLGLRRRK